MSTSAPAPGASPPPERVADASAPAARTPRAHPLASDDGRSGIMTVMMAATLLRFWQLGKQGLWIDEGWTWVTASLLLPRLLERCMTGDASPPLVSPPLFYLLTSLMLRLGQTEVHLRLISVAASIGTVWVTYRLARLLANRRVSTLAAGFTALSAFQIQEAQEARNYSLAAFLTVLGLYLFARAILRGRRRAWVPYVVVSVLALYTQAIAMLGSAVQAVVVIASRTGRRKGVSWALAQGAIFGAFLPWLAAGLQQATHAATSHSHWFIRSPTPHSAFQVLRTVFVSPMPLVSAIPGTSSPGLDHYLPRWLLQAILVAVPAVPIIAAMSRLRERSAQGQMVRFLAACLFLPLLAVFVLSFQKPLWLPRYFSFLTPFVSVLTAVGIARLRPPRLALAWTALLFVIAGYSGFRYFSDYSKEPWREVAQSIAARSTPNQAVVLVAFDPDAMSYYQARVRGVPPVVDVSHPDVPFDDAFSAAQMVEMEQMARQQTARFPEVWLVTRRAILPAREEVEERTRRAAGEGRVLAVRERWQSFQGPLFVWCWRRAP